MIKNSQNRKQAVILFVSNENIHNRKGFHSPKTYNLLNDHLRETVADAKNEIDFDTILCSDFKSLVQADLFIKQTGSSFNKRFNNAISKTFQLGYEELIIIGNDSPDLTTQHLIETLKNLSKAKIVVGPSQDGGIYLLGLTKNSLTSKIKARWNTSFVKDDILIQFNSEKIYLLEQLKDIDSHQDLIDWYSLDTAKSKLFYELILSWVSINYKQPSHPFLYFTEQNIYRVQTQKAPPRAFSFA